MILYSADGYSIFLRQLFFQGCAMSNNDILFCRKAVVNRGSDTVAYYILHPVASSDSHNSLFLSALFVDVNLSEITQQKTIYIKTSLDELQALPLQNNIHAVFFLNAAELNEENFEILSDLRLQGHVLGISNPQVSDFSSEFFNIFTHVHFSLDRTSVNDVISRLAGPLLELKTIWVNKVETADQYSLLQEKLPVGQFSGNFIHKMTSVKGKRILAYQAILIDLLAALNNRETSPKKLAECIERDPTLTYRIIKLTHSAMYRSQFNVSNAQRAIEIIGIRDLIKWVSLVMLGSVDGKPACIFSMALSRACFCNNLSALLFPKLEGAFLVGLFSYLPSFLDEELEVLLKDLPLEENIKIALIESKGNLGGVLKVVKAYEAGQWSKIPFDHLIDREITQESLRELYVKSLKDAREMGAF